MQSNDTLLNLPDLEQTINRSPTIVTPDTPLKDVIFWMTLPNLTQQQSLQYSTDEEVTPTRMSNLGLNNTINGHRNWREELNSNRVFELSNEVVGNPVQLIQESYVLVMELGEILGIFTSSDLVQAIASGHSVNSDIQIAEFMTPCPVRLNLKNAGNIFTPLLFFRQYKIGHLPILDPQGQLLGIVTPGSILQSLKLTNLFKLSTVEEVMNTQLVYASCTTSLQEIAKQLAQSATNCVVITDQASSIPVGIITEAMIIQAWASGMNFSRTPASWIVRQLGYPLKPENSLLFAYHQMQSDRHSTLLVCEPKTEPHRHILGSVTDIELLRSLEPLQIYRRLKRTQQSVCVLQAEKAELLRQRNTELEFQVQERTTQLQTALKAVEQQARQATLLNKIVQAMRGTLILDEMLQTTVNQLHDALNMSRCLIFRPDAEQEFVPRYVSETTVGAESLIGIRCDLYRYYYPQLSQGKIVNISGIDQSYPPEVQHAAEACQIRAILIVPLMYQQSYIGGISLHECEQERQWTAHEESLLQAIADHCAIAIHQAELYQQVQTQLQERRKAEAALAEREELFRQLAENIQQVFFVRDLKLNRLLYVSPAFDQIWGYSREILQQKPNGFLDAVHPEDQERILAAFETSFPNHPYHQEYRIIRPDGEIRWVVDRAFPLTNEQGEVYRITGLVEDITERKKAEIALREQQQFLQESNTLIRLITDHLPALISLIDHQERYRFVNRQYEEYFELPAPDIVGKSVREVIGEENYRKAKKQIQHVLSGKTVTFENTLSLKNGQKHYMLVKMLPQFDSTGIVQGCFMLAQDISDRKRAEEAMGESEKRFRLMADQAPVLIWLTEKDGCCSFVNKTCLEFTGRNLEDHLGNGWTEIIHPEDSQRCLETVSQAEAQYQSFQIEYRLKRASGEYAWVWEHGVPRFTASGEFIGYMGTAVDITTRKNAEFSLKESQEMLRLIIDNIPQYVFWKDRNSVFLGCNQNFAKAAGLENPEQIIGKTDYDLPWTKAESDGYRAFDQRIIKRNQPEYQIIETQKQADGQLRWLETNKIPLHDSEGNVIGILGTYEDITKQKELQEEQRKTQAILEGIFNNTYQLTVLLDLEGNLLKINQTALNFSGFKETDVIGKPLWKLRWWEISQETQECLKDAIAMAAQGRFVRYEVDIRGNNDTVTPIDFSLKPIFNDQNQVMQLIAEGRDISARKRAEAQLQKLNEDLEIKVQERTQILRQTVQKLAQEVSLRQQAEATLRESQQQLQSILDNSPAMIDMRDLEGRYLFINRTLAQLFNLNPAEIVSQKIDSVFPPEVAEVLDVHYQEVIHRNAPLEFEEVIPIQNQPHTYICVKFPLKDRDGKMYAVCGICTDITLRKRAEEAWRESEAKFQKMAANVPGMIYQYVVHPDGSYHFPYISASSRQIWEVDPEAVYEDPEKLHGMIHADDVPSLIASTQVSATTLQPWHWEGRIITPSGRLKWLQGDGRPEKQENGDILWDGLIIDISDRKAAEEALRNSELRLQLALDAAQMGTWDWNIHSHQVIGSEKTESIFGFAPGTFPTTQEAFIGCIPPEEQKRVQQLLQQALAEKIPHNWESQIIQPDGTIRWIACIGNILCDEVGNPKRMTGVIMDITERKQTEESLRRQLAAVEAASDGIAILNQQGQYIYLNQAHVNIFGYDRAEELIGKSWHELYYADEAERMEREVFFTLEQQGKYQGEAVAKRRDGTTFAQEISFTSIADGGLICVCRDISERKQTEEILRLRDRAISASRNGIIIVDARLPDQPVIYVNPAFERMTGYSGADVIGKNCRFLQGEETEQEGLEALRQAIQGGYDSTVVIRNYRKDGSLFWNELTISPIHDEDRVITHFIGIQTDITERKVAEAEIRNSLREKEVLLKEIHHRVKNNLQVISSLLKLQSAYIEDDTTLNLFMESYNRVKSMALIHEQLYQSQNLGKIEGSNYIRELTGNLLRSYQVPSKTIDLNLNIEEIPLDIDTAIPCGLIINELVTNSLKYAFVNRNHGEVRIEFLRHSSEHLCLKVSDNGVGLSPDFNRENIESLGLQLVYNLTEQLDGKIEIDRQSGTSFMIIFTNRN